MAHTVENLMNTSCDDMKCTIGYITDIDLLQRTHRAAVAREYKTKALHLERRIKTLQKEQAQAAALSKLSRLVFSLGTIIDHLEEDTKAGGLKVHAETWKALHRHQRNLGGLVAEAMRKKEVPV